MTEGHRFQEFAERVQKGGRLTDADVNEWINRSRPRKGLMSRFFDWLLEVFSDAD